MVDRFTLFFAFVLCLGGGLACLLAGGYLPEHKLERGEFFPLVMFSTVGAMALAAAGDLLSLFIALETMSLGVYCLIGLRRTSARAAEAALLVNVAWPALKLFVAREVVPSLKVTVPVGVPLPGAVALTVAVMITCWPKTDGLSEETSVVEVLALLFVCVSELVLALKLPSPL